MLASGRYCESFGHTCVSAAEEVADNCDVKYAARCDEAITGTSDMLCTCRGSADAVIARAPSGGEAWRTSGERVGGGWCSALKPASDWSLLQSCGHSVQVSVLSYNLYWRPPPAHAQWCEPRAMFRDCRCDWSVKIRTSRKPSNVA